MTMINLQRTANLYNEAYKSFGMLVNIKKTLDTHPAGSRKETADVSINIEGQRVEVVE